MTWDGEPRRAEDAGKDSLRVLIVRIEEGLKNHLKNYDADKHANKGDHAEIRARIELETTKIRKEISDQNVKNEDTIAETKNDIKWLLRYAYIAMGAVVVINVVFIPIVVQHMIKKLNAEVGFIKDHDRIT